MTEALVAHIGIAVADLEKAVRLYSLLNGRGPSEIIEVADQKVKVAFFDSASSEADGETKIELLAPLSPESPIKKFISRRGEGLHHICLWVDNIEAKMKELADSGLRLIDEKPRRGAEGHLIAFVHPGSAGGVLIELQQRAK